MKFDTKIVYNIQICDGNKLCKNEGGRETQTIYS